MNDLKQVYHAATKEAVEMALDELEAKWGSLYPLILQSWRRKWENLTVYFKYSENVRKVIYTTKTIEAVHQN